MSDMTDAEATARARVLAESDRRREKLTNEQFHVGDEVAYRGGWSWVVISRERRIGDLPAYEITNLDGSRLTVRASDLELGTPGTYRKFG